MHVTIEPSSDACSAPETSESSATTTSRGALSHLDARAKQLVEKSLATRAREILGDTIIVHPRLAGIINEVSWLIDQPPRFRARGLIVTSPPGNGKTAIGELLKNKYPLPRSDLAAHGQTKACVVHISLAGARTVKAVFVRILEALGAPPARGSTSDLESRVHDVLLRAKVRLIILDEAQDVLGFLTGEQSRVIQTIKNMMNQLRLPVLALGTDAAEWAFRSDAHMQARFECIKLPTWNADDEFAEFLRKYEQTLPLRNRSGLDNPMIVKTLLKQSEGVLDPILMRIKWAAIAAMINGEERITLDLIKEVTAKPDVKILRETTP